MDTHMMTRQGPAHRLEGRLFAEDGNLCMVLEVDADAGTARISSRKTLFDMPLNDVTSRLAAYTHLSLDGLNSHRNDKRLTEEDDGWYFRSREQERHGPFATRDEANHAMGQYIIAAQEGRQPNLR